MSAFIDLTNGLTNSQFSVVEIPIVEGVATLQANKANVLDATDATVTINMPTVTDGKENTLHLYLKLSTSSAPTFDASVVYCEGLADIAQYDTDEIFEIMTVDNGVTWYATCLAGKPIA